MLEESMSASPSFWDSLVSWFTPTVLFLFLNLMIGTIAITSGLNKPDPDKHRRPDDTDSRQLPGSPSVLKSVNLYAHRSLEPEKSPDSDAHFADPEQIDSRRLVQPPLSRSPSLLQRLKSINLQSYFSQESVPPIESLPRRSPEMDNRSNTQEEKEMEHEAVAERSRNEEQTLEEVYSQLKVAQVSGTKFDTEPTSGEIPTKLPRKMRKSASTKSAFAHSEEEDAVEKRRPATMREGKVKAAEEAADEEVDAKADDFINRFKQQLKLQRIDSIIRS